MYQKTRELKEAIAKGGDASAFRVADSEKSVYLIFMEDSTRTKESFRNAAEFHGMKVNMFDCGSSSFKKSETITDTIKMLSGYSVSRSTFVIRSKVEGVCRWLEDAISKHARRLGVPQPSFVNAGDGRHEHPTQEFLDEFSFLEHKGWDTSSIHLALLGDLYHGRTVHSKVDGLKIYDRVEVDLIAPSELGLPASYETRMREAGFTVRKFASIAEYLEQGHVAEIWYFTRLQLERMGDRVLSQADRLREAVTMRHEFIDKVPTSARFFHPLPRDSRNPDLPFWLDDTKFNGWDQQSQNGYFTRITLLALVSGHLGEDFQCSTPRRRIADLTPTSGHDGNAGITPMAVKSEQVRLTLLQSPGQVNESALRESTDFIEILKTSEKQDCNKKQFDMGIRLIQKGVVIDHIGKGSDPQRIWNRMAKVRTNLDLNMIGAHGVYQSSSGDQKTIKGLMSLPDFDVSKWERADLKRLAALAPGSTLNVIEGGKVLEKFRLHVPPRIYNFPDIICQNSACVSNPANGQREVVPYFIRKVQEMENSNWEFTCKYCEHVYSYDSIWTNNYDYKSI
jgi:aspartate carbamoyltransferase